MNPQIPTKLGELCRFSNRLAHCLVILAILSTTATIAAVARADPLQGDPRKCSDSRIARICAHEAAVIVLRRFLAIRTKSAQQLYQGISSCVPTAASTILRWNCSWGGTTNAGPAAGTATVWFRALSTGWKRLVTVTSG